MAPITPRGVCVQVAIFEGAIATVRLQKEIINIKQYDVYYTTWCELDAIFL
jgi:hypothetical protein